MRRLFDRFVAIAREHGPVTVIPQRNPIALQVRMRFAALKCHLVLAQRHDSPQFEKIETYSPRNHLHVFRLTSESDFDRGFCGCIREAYRVGCQEHVNPGSRERSGRTREKLKERN
ncbi:MAG: hypothetical protein FJW26_14290 [Acidimicrobiia bacterium]|nr:hypothetical protein [Acidimicrobiia bacterium]